MQYYLTSFILCFMGSLCAQPSDLPDFSSDKCYAKCLIKNNYEVYEEEFPIYLGNEPEKIDFDTIELVIHPETTKWVKRKTESNCLSDNPEDCLVWSRVEIPKESITVVYMQDPTQSDLVDWVVYEVKELKEEEPQTEWREVICENKMTFFILKQIQEVLAKEGYYPHELITKQSSIVGNSYSREKTVKVDLQTKAALTKYQKDNGLPIGHLDIETLGALGIDW